MLDSEEIDSRDTLTTSGRGENPNFGEYISRGGLFSIFAKDQRFLLAAKTKPNHTRS